MSQLQTALTFFSPDSALSSYEDIHASDFEISFEDGETVIAPKRNPEDERENFDYENEFEAIVESVRSESNRIFGRAKPPKPNRVIISISR